MNWTEPTPPTKGVSYYDHTMCDTPLGQMRIEWKSWKISDSYDIEVDGKWIGCEYDLEEAKAVALKHLTDLSEKINKFLQP